MKRYWFEFEFIDSDIPFGTNMGCGVTAYNYDDAINLLNEKVFKSRSIPKIQKMIESVDVSTLDAGHVLPNMSSPNIRGIWFPLGYS